MTKITIDRAVAEQALHVATVAGYPVALIAALRAALAEPEPPIGKASTDVGVPVFVVKKAEPVQEQCKGDPGECEFNGGCMYACAKPEPPLHKGEAMTDCANAIIALRAALAEPVEPVKHKHQWFSTGAMEPGEMRCIHCGAWAKEKNT